LVGPSVPAILMCMPQVCIAVPVLNGAGFLERALLSIEAQTFTDWVCVVSDNASTDETRAICENFLARDSRFRLISQHTTVQNAQNFRACLEANREADYFAWLAADDWLHPEAVALFVRGLEEHPSAGLAWGPHCTIIDGRVNVVRGVDLSSRVGVGRLSRFLLEFGHVRDAPFYGLYRREVLERALFWLDCSSVGFRMAYSVLTHVLTNSKFVFVPYKDPLWFNLLHSESSSSRIATGESRLSIVRLRYRSMLLEVEQLPWTARLVARMIIRVWAWLEVRREFLVDMWTELQSGNVRAAGYHLFNHSQRPRFLGGMAEVTELRSRSVRDPV